jgi:hypothetical protein
MAALLTILGPCLIAKCNHIPNFVERRGAALAIYPARGMVEVGDVPYSMI